MQSVLIAAIGGAVGGALGALLGLGVGRLLPQKWRRGVAMACALALALVGGRLAPMVAGPARTTDVASMEAELLADPTVGDMSSAWKQSDPASFQGFVTRLNSAAQSGNRAAALELARTEVVGAARPRLRYLSDPELVELVRISRDQMRELQTTHPIACHPLFHGRAFGDIAPYISAPVRQRELTLLASAFRADANAQLPTLSGEALTTAIDRVVAATQAEFGDDIGLIAPDAVIEDREPRVCEAAAALYDHVQRLPEADAASLMRGLIVLAG